MFSKKVCAFFIIGLVLAGGCTPRQESADDPKNRLNEYISQSFAVKSAQDRRILASYLTGDAKTRIESWSDEQFRQAFIESKRQFVKLAFKEVKSVSPTEVGITYELTYYSHDAKITNKKLAQMLREKDKWMVSDVRSIKELVEYKNEMSLP